MKLKRYQTITLVILLWTLAVSVQLQNRINNSAAVVVEKYLGYPMPFQEVKQQPEQPPTVTPSPCTGIAAYLPFPFLSLGR